MQANWGLVLNVVLLVGVVLAIARMLVAKNKQNYKEDFSRTMTPTQSVIENNDDIIAVRKIEDSYENNTKPIINPSFASNIKEQDLLKESKDESFVDIVEDINNTSNKNQAKSKPSGELLVMFLLAKEDKKLVGYELLQAVLASGLRFGEGNLFHRHQNSNGQGTVMCSLAAATDKGTFDLQNIGAFSAKGLCLYMHLSGNSSIDEERFDIMHDTAKNLSEELNTYLLDDRKKQLTDDSIKRYYQKINIVETA
jgi:cell division protein ZipA